MARKEAAHQRDRRESDQMKTRLGGFLPANPWKVGDRVRELGYPRGTEGATAAGTVAECEGALCYVNWDPPSASGPFLTTKVPASRLRASTKKAPRGGGGATVKAPKRPKVKEVFLVVKEWHRRSVGGMYSSVSIFMNGEFIVKLGPVSGSADYAKQFAGEWLMDNGYVKGEKYAHGGYQPLWQIAKNSKFKLNYTVSEVAREKDL